MITANLDIDFFLQFFVLGKVSLMAFEDSETVSLLLDRIYEGKKKRSRLRIL